MALDMVKVKAGLNAAAKYVSGFTGTLARFSVNLDPLVKIPLVGSMIAEVQDIIYMLNDYFRGEYKNVPKTVLFGCAGIVLYLASPIDLIPDNVPLLGFVDDAFVVKTIMNLCVGKELDKYREWKAQQPDELPDAEPAEA